MDLYQDDSTLQTNLRMKQQELEDLLCPQELIMPLTPTVNETDRHEIRFQNYQYKVFKSTYNHHNHYQPRNNVPQPKKVIRCAIKETQPLFSEESTNVPLRSLLPMDVIKRPRRITPYERLMQKLHAVLFYLRDLGKQRDQLLFAVKNSSDAKSLYFSKLHQEEEHPQPCCRGSETENLSLIISKATEVVQSATMESNLYRGMILLIGNNCDLLDSYSSMTSRLMLKELEECIDDVMGILNEFIGSHNCLGSFEAFAKHNELLAAVDSLITCIRCCASYIWAMKSRIDQKCESAYAVSAAPRTPEKYINIGSI